LIPALKLDRGIAPEILTNRPPIQFASEAQATVADGLLQFQMERAEKGSENAQYALGMRYLKGDGVPQDDAIAKSWLEKSAAQGNAQAKIALIRFKASK
jgi:TPR repeat protein